MDDEPALLDVGKEFLERSGSVLIDTAPSAAEAQQKVLANRYDAIVSDYQMPGMNGIEFLKWVKKTSPGLPFILFTGKGREEVVIEALNHGADFYLQKGGMVVPQFAELEHKIKQAVQQQRNEQMVAESEERYRTLFENANDAIFLMDRDIYIDCNKKAPELFGCARNDLIGSSVGAHSPATQPDGQDSGEKSRAMISQALLGEPGIFDWRHLRPDGEEIDVEVSLTRLGVPGRDHLLAIVRDAGERKQVESVLRESAQLMTGLISFLPDATFAINSDGRVIAWNRSMESLTGVSAGEIIGKGDYAYAVPLYGKPRPILIDLICTHDAATASLYGSIEVDGDQMVSEGFFPDLNGGNGAHLWFTASPLLDSHGKIIGAIESIRDITAHKTRESDLRASYEQVAAMEEELRNNFEELAAREQAVSISEAKFHSLFSTMAEGSELGEIVTDGDGKPVEYRILEVNPAFEKIFSITRERVLGKLSHEVFGTDVPEALACYAEVAFSGIPRTFEVWYPPMKKHFAISVYSPKKGQFATVFEDITVRKQNEQALREAYEQIAVVEEELRNSFEELSAREQALRTSQGLMNDIISFLPDATFAVNAEGRVIAWNLAMEKLSGVSARDMIGKGDYEYSVPLYGEKRPILIDLIRTSDRKIASRYDSIQNDGDKMISELFLPYLYNGKGAHIWFTASPFFDSHGTLIGAIESIRDITAHKTRESDLRASYEQVAAMEEELRNNFEELAAREQAVSQSEAKFRSLFAAMVEGSALGEILTDDAGNPAEYRILEVNPAFERIFGIARDHAVGRLSREVFGKNIPEAVRLFARVASTGISQSFETWYPPMMKHFAISVYSPKKGLFATVFEDITVRKENEQALREAYEQIAVVEEELRSSFGDLAAREQALRASEEQYRRIVETANEGIWVLDAGFVTTFVNQKLADMLGYTAAEIVGRPITGFMLDEDIADHDQRVQARRRGAAERYERRLTRKDGGILWCIISGTPVFSGAGEFQGSFAMLTDITAGKLAEQELAGKVAELNTANDEMAMTLEELRSAEESLVARNRELEEQRSALVASGESLTLANRKLNLLSNITRHDVLNQLMVLNSYIELSRESPEEEIHAYREKQLDAIRRIQQQIMFTRDYQDIGVKAPCWQGVKTVVGSAAAGLDLSGIRLELDIPEVEIYADPLLPKVFYNIFDNAMRYGGKTTRVAVSCRTGADGLVVAVEDDGVGINPGDKKFIFEKGFGKNTGYGLFLTAEILQITGLSITETGSPGAGARFEIMVPQDVYRFCEK